MSDPDPSLKRSIVIIGGGIIGCTTAYFLTRHPIYNPDLHSIHLLEATAIASGASGKAGGLLALWAYPQAIVPLSFRLHAELAREHGGAEKWGYRGVGVGEINLKGRKLAGTERVLQGAGTEKVEGEAEEGNGSLDGKVQPPGEHDPSRVSLQKRSKDSYKNLARMGVPDDLDWVAEECVMGYEKMGTPLDTAQVHPYQFTTSMARLAEEKGATIILGSVDRIETGDGDDSGTTPQSSLPQHRVYYTDKATNERKSLPATDVIVTAGPWTGAVWPGTPISALRAHSVTIRPSRPVSAYCLFTSLSLPKDFKPPSSPSGKQSRKKQHVTPEIYARPNNEIYACGEGDTLVSLPASSADVVVDAARCQDIVDQCASISDEMRDGEVLVRQACYLPQVDTGGGPLIGLTKTKGVYVAAGHTCWGIQNGPGTGKIMSEFVFAGKAKSADVRGLDPRRVV